MGASIALGLLGVLTPKQVFSGLSNSTVVLFAGMFVIGAAMFQTGLAQRIGITVVHAAGTGEKRLMAAIMIVTIILSSVSSNTATVACLLPVVTVGAAKASVGMKSPRKGGYDNHNPRQWEAGLTGWQQRANAAQANGFEALPLFIAAVLMAQQAQADQGVIDQWALAFIGIRLAYIASYLMDKAALRSLIWMAGVAVCIYIMSLAG